MAMTGHRSALERIQFFAGLRPVVVYKLEPVARPLACADGQLIVLAGDVEETAAETLERFRQVATPEFREERALPRCTSWSAAHS